MHSTITTLSAPCGHRRAGHDARGLAGADLDARDVVAGGDVRDDVELDRRVSRRAGEVGGAHGEAVHRGVVERRDVDVAARVLGEHAAERVEQRDLARRAAASRRARTSSRASSTVMTRSSAVTAPPRRCEDALGVRVDGELAAAGVAHERDVELGGDLGGQVGDGAARDATTGTRDLAALTVIS